MSVAEFIFHLPLSVDQLFHSSEQRLARALLLLAHIGEAGARLSAIPKISQETLGQMIRTTRSLVSGFMRKFKCRGYIQYAGNINRGIEVRPSLKEVIEQG